MSIRSLTSVSILMHSVLQICQMVPDSNSPRLQLLSVSVCLANNGPIRRLLVQVQGSNPMFAAILECITSNK
ncbi:hypothetical protein FPV67DRAFT_158832 [Lyophyllum atratum]|nr:hypothetical protein FPV67DRAFT_158832 [Lyophyllum atratum]